MGRFARRLQRATADIDVFVLGVTEPKPNDGSVGVRNGVSLTAYSGNFLFTANNQVVRNLDISGYVNFQGYSGCLLENCIVRGGPAPGYPDTHTLVRFFDAGGRIGSNNTMRYCEVRPSDPSVDVYGVGGWGWTVERCIIVDVVDATNMHQSTTSGSNIKGGKLYGNYLETLWYANDPRQNDGTHNDGVQIFAGSTNEIIGNSFQHPSRHGNCIVFSPQSNGQLMNTKIKYNWFRGGYTQISCWDSNNSFIDVPGVEIVGNRHGMVRGSSGDHQWELLITQANYDQRTNISGNVLIADGSPSNININN